MPKNRIVIDREACVGDGLCSDEACGAFELDEDEVAVVIDPEGDTPEKILEAAQSCPTDAIALFDAETDDQVHPED